MSLREVELATKIRGNYLIQIEAGAWRSLPNDVYTRGFVRTYAEFLGLDARAIVKAYELERGGRPQRPSAKRPGLEPEKRFYLTSRLLTVVGVVALIAGVAAYLSWQFSALAAPPRIDLNSPEDNQVVYGSLVDVSGFASGGADVFINDSPILTDGNGNFSEKLALQDGVNTIKITAKSKLGKISEETRNILAKLPSADPAAVNAPAETFDGVAVSVAIKDSAARLVVEVDGKEAFNGTMLPGTAQLFKGTGIIKITTSNAGATNLVITNSVAARKAISPVGKAGETKRGLEFAKDTVIP